MNVFLTLVCLPHFKDFQHQIYQSGVSTFMKVKIIVNEGKSYIIAKRNS